MQAAARAGKAGKGAKERGDPLILLGDFNATQRTVVHRTLADRLTDAYALRPDRRPRVATFPATMPMLRIDHVFVSRGVKVIPLPPPPTPLPPLASHPLPLLT